MPIHVSFELIKICLHFIVNLEILHIAFKLVSMKLKKTFSNNQTYRKWEKVIEPLVKYDRESS